MNPVESAIEIGLNKLAIDSIAKIANGAKIKLPSTSTFKKSMDASRLFLDQMLANGEVIYGVNTGFGDSCTTSISLDLVNQLPINITRYHGCGLGAHFDEKTTRAIQAVRLASLVTGKSGVSIDLLQTLASHLNKGICPIIPQEGSVGASGDLTPLSYLASALIGEGEVRYNEEILPSLDVLNICGISPYRLKPKEGLALMNGTSVMTAIACLAYERTKKLNRFSAHLTAMNVMALHGNPDHFDEGLFLAKPHLGQSFIADIIRQDLSKYSRNHKLNRLQDRYSLRCAPHVIGVSQDFLSFAKVTIETELNSANDNPLIDAPNKAILHGGNFYGGHIAFVMDSLKNLVANIGDLLDRQMALIVDPKFNNGLPANLSGADHSKISINHGLKALQISTSAWTAEALKNTMPASVFSRSTECHNQDKVSMGTIAARDCMRNLELIEQVLVAVSIASCQAVDLRVKEGSLSLEQLSQSTREMYDLVRSKSKFLTLDRKLDVEMRDIIATYQAI